jgi:predicted ester cyclase
LARVVGEFAGIPPTQRDVRVPIAILYDLEDGWVSKGRIFLQAAVLFQQLGQAPPR